jgi:hypothetical protein
MRVRSSGAVHTTLPVVEHADTNISMTADDELASLKEGIFRNIGRNIVLLQQIEAQLRWLVTNTEFGGPLSGIDVLRQKRLKHLAKCGIGNLSSDYWKSVLKAPLAETPAKEEKAEEVSEAQIHVRLHVAFDEAALRVRRRDLKVIVAERNELVHRLLPKWSPASRESCEAMMAWLDEQHRRAAGELLALEAECKMVVSSMESVAKFFGSEAALGLFKLKSDLQ